MTGNATGDTGVFACRSCGECCHGSGGIVLQHGDILRLAEHLGLPLDGFCARYAEKHRGVYRLRSGKDGACVFWDNTAHCAVHAAKPDVCRAWPFFRGNLEDATSLFMARECCLGIHASVSFTQFRQAGFRWLLSAGVFRHNEEPASPRALMTQRELLAQAEDGANGELG